MNFIFANRRQADNLGLFTHTVYKVKDLTCLLIQRKEKRKYLTKVQRLLEICKSENKNKLHLVSADIKYTDLTIKHDNGHPNYNYKHVSLGGN